MKRFYYVITLIILALVVHSAPAQVRAGLKAGGSISALRTRHTQNSTTRLIRYHAGLLSEADLSKKFYLRGELLYSVKGWGYATVQEGRSMNLHYLSLPVLLTYRPKAKIALLAGPEVGYLLQAIKKPAAVSIDFNDLYQKWDLGLALGASYALTSRLGIELRYSYGIKALSEVMLSDENGNPTKLDKDGYNQALQVGLFYRWGKEM